MYKFSKIFPNIQLNNSIPLVLLDLISNTLYLFPSSIVNLKFLNTFDVRACTMMSGRGPGNRLKVGIATCWYCMDLVLFNRHPISLGLQTSRWHTTPTSSDGKSLKK